MNPRPTSPDPDATEPLFSVELTPRGTARPALAIVALSEDPMLLEALTQAAAGETTVVTSPSADRFADQLVANAAAVALIDAAVAPAPLDDFLATMHRQFPQLLLLLSGPAVLQTQFAAQVADGTIFRFVHKPASAQRLKLFIDAALLRRQTLIAQATVLPSAADVAHSAPGTHARRTDRGGPRRWLRPVILVLSLVAAAALGAMLWERLPAFTASLRNPPATPLVQPTPAKIVDQAAASQAAQNAQAARAAEAEREAIDRAAADRAERDRILSDSEAREAALAEQLRRTTTTAHSEQARVYVQLAHKRLTSGALLEPSDDSARTYVQAAVALAPDDAEVRAVAGALGEALIAKLRAAVDASDQDAAGRWLQACRDYKLSDGELEPLVAQLGSLKHAQSSQLETQSAQRSFSQHLSAGALLEPADDSALGDYRHLRTLDPGNAALTTMQHGLRSAVAADVLARIARNDLSGAQQRLHTAVDAGLDGDELVVAAGALQKAQDAAAEGYVPESQLKRVHFVTPSFPDDALARGMNGSVELEFTVTPSGGVADIKVIAADPPGVFEQAAIHALSQCRYRPVEMGGKAVAQRARLKLRFKP
ncbi:MAG TPA: energy transducer TonB [Steroidobacteraceae bacterium]|jgi:TonB family protein